MLTLFMWGVSLTHPLLPIIFYAGSFPYTSRAGFPFYQLRFSYTSHAGFIFLWRVSLTCLMLVSFFNLGDSFTHPVLASFVSGEFLLHIPCYLQEFLLHIPCRLHISVGSFSYTSRAGFIFIWGVSLRHPVLTLFLCGEIFLHISGCIDVYARSFSYTSRAGTKCTKTAL